MRRKTFLQWAALGAVGAPLLRSGEAAGADPNRRLGCTTVSFRHRFAATRPKGDRAVGPDFSLLDMPAMFVGELGLRQVEVWSRHFAETTPAYAEKLRAAAARAGARIINVQQDEAPHDLSNADPEKRRACLGIIMRWMDLARACGSPSLRANTGGRAGEPFDLSTAADSYRRLAEHGERIGVCVLVENHGGHSARAENVAAIVRAVNSPWCRSLPDFGNLPAGVTPAERVAFLNQILPFADLISAKGMRFNAAYEHVSYDLAPCVQAAKQAGFKGIYSIEVWTPTDPPADPLRAVRSVADVIRRQL